MKEKLLKQYKRIKELEEMQKAYKEISYNETLQTFELNNITNGVKTLEIQIIANDGTSTVVTRNITVQRNLQARSWLDEPTSNAIVTNNIKSENQQLKQQLHELPKKIVEEIKRQMGSIEDILINCGNGKEDALCWFNECLDTILKKY